MEFEAAAAFGQFIGAHALGAKGGVVEAIFRVQPPTSIVQQTAFGLQAAIKRRIGVGHQHIEGREGEAVFESKFEQALQRFDRIMIVPQGKSGPGLQAVLPENGNLLAIAVEAAADVGGFAHRP